MEGANCKLEFLRLLQGSDFMQLIYLIAYWLLTCLMWLVFLSAILSWFPRARNGALSKFVNSIVNPLLLPFRAILPSLGGFDLSPLAAILLLSFLRRLLQAG
jgi:YggT family protein